MQCTAAAGGAVAERPTAARHAAGMMRGADATCETGDEPARAVHRARARRAPVIWLFSIFNARQRLVLLARGYSYVFPCPLSAKRSRVLFKSRVLVDSHRSRGSPWAQRLTSARLSRLFFVQGYPEHKVTNRPSVTGHTRTAFSSSAGTQYTLDPAANRRLMFVRVLCAPRLASKRTRGRPRRS